MRQRHDQRAFTLIELLLVMAILALLAGILITGIQAAQNKAKLATTKTLIQNIEMAVKDYEESYGAYPGSSRSGTDEPQDDPSTLVRALVISRKMEFKIDRIGVGDPVNMGNGKVFFPKGQRPKTLQELYQLAESGTEKLWVLDYWDAPMHYVEYYSRNSDKKTAVTQNAYGEQTDHQPQKVDGVDIWSNGANSKDDGGASSGTESDDVNNWQQ